MRRGNRKAGSMKSSVATADREMFAQFNVFFIRNGEGKHEPPRVDEVAASQPASAPKH